MFSHLHPDVAALRAQRDTFRAHLQDLLAHPDTTPGGLSYLPSPRAYTYTLAKGASVQLLVIGGTRTESVLYHPATRSFTHRRHASTPILDSASTLLNLVASLREHAGTLVLNFTFPMRPHLRGDQLDGTLLRGTKAHVLEGLVDESVGAYLEHHLPHPPQIIVINDITTLLSSFASQGVQVAGVLGTGGNFGLKWRDDYVNLETGNYRDFVPDEAVQALDRASDNPGQQLWEKSTSGKYLKDHFNHYAARANLPERLESSHELDELSAPRAVELSQAIYRRSAGKVAVTIAALLESSGEETLVMEGGVFWEASGYSEYVHEYLEALGHPSVHVLESKHPFENLTSILR